MKITHITATQPNSPGCPPDWRLRLGQILVKITTDTNLTGIGIGGGGKAGIHVIETVLQPRLLGADAGDVEGLWQEMYQLTLPYGQAGLAIMAISSIDLALWDLRAKAANLPVAKILNPNADLTKPIPTYTTCLSDPSTAIAQGHTAIKLHVDTPADTPPDQQLKLALNRVRQTRDALGPLVTIMVDAFGKWNLKTALAAAEQLEPYNITWLEDPLPCNDFDGYETLAKNSPIPIAGGEHIYTAKTFAQIIDRRLHHILIPDITWCGGLTELVKIYQLAQQANIRVVPHRGAEPFALHAIAALDNQPLAESGRPWITWLKGQPQMIEGKVTLSTAPGFGVTA